MTVVAVFATLGVKDHDGDVILPGAFENGALVRMSAWNHQIWSGTLPIGKGRIYEVGEEAVFRGEFFKTQAAQDMRETLKGLGSLAEFSFGYDVLDSEQGEFQGERVRYLKSLKTHEISPVLLGAGINTHLVDIKEQGRAVYAEETADPGLNRAERRELIALKEQLRRDEIIELLTMRRQLDADIERAAATAELKELGVAAGLLVGYREAAPHAVPEAVRKAAQEAVTAHGPGTKVRWFTDELDPAKAEFIDTPMAGWCRPKAGLREIWINAGLDAPRAASTVAHEIAHLDGADEPTAQLAGLRAAFERGLL
ncbi:HK97 family phage prohead protease [Streptomyces sp. TLI_185]|uniref:HK97 family phage prohead protease n=1 Tax=Streptomyces sp. TLI_185 TaxID=2485151 RepID=UPI0016102A97|nr:HK97 family phage prohead protease [Streptomyces sp. TLI_185]